VSAEDAIATRWLVGHPTGGSLDQPTFLGVERGFGPGVRVRLIVDVGDVPLDCAHAEDEIHADFAAAAAGGHQPQHLPLTLREAIRERFAPDIPAVRRQPARLRRESVEPRRTGESVGVSRLEVLAFAPGLLEEPISIAPSLFPVFLPLRSPPPEFFLGLGAARGPILAFAESWLPLSFLNASSWAVRSAGSESTSVGLID